jgi:hypothetical protein
MPKAFVATLLTACLLGGALPAVLADTAPRQIQWQDLAPKAAPAGNPFERLTRDQLAALSEVAAVRDRVAAGDKSVTATDQTNALATAKRLEQAGLDVDALLATRKEMTEHRRSKGAQVNPLLEGQTVRLPGYLLPLELSGKRVTEFLLVPWVGACVHTPPPPPNQIVHVKADAAFEMTSLFEPVWVTGKLSTGAVKKSLYMVDGSSDIDIGYSIRGAKVEAYKP